MAQSLWISNGGYGGDLVLSPQGGLLAAIDTPNSPDATNQFLARLLLTNPQVKDAAGNILARGDSLFYPDFGVGVGSIVDATVTASLIANLQAVISGQMALYPRFLRNPAPVISVTQPDKQSLSISITYTLNTGQTHTTPDISLTVGG